MTSYPGLNPFLLSEEGKVGLYLNRGRAELAWVWRLAQALLWAQHRGPLPRELFEAATDTAAEADELEYKVNSRRPDR